MHTEELLVPVYILDSLNRLQHVPISDSDTSTPAGKEESGCR